MHFRRNNIQDASGDALVSYEVAVYPVGGVVSSAVVSTNVINLRPPHSFKVGDKFLHDPADNAIYSTVYTVASLTATSITMTAGSTFDMAVGDAVVNLGPDGSASATPDFDASPMGIYNEPQGVTPLSQARVVVNADGEYSYYYRGDGIAWEVILNSSDAPVDLIQGFGWQHRLNIADFGARTDTADNDTYVRSAVVAGQQLDLPVMVPRGTFMVGSVVVDDPCVIEGASVTGSVLAGIATTGAAISVTDFSTTHEGDKNFVLRNIKLTQTGQALNTDAPLLAVDGAINHCLLDNVFVTADVASALTTNGVGIRIKQAEKATLREVQVIGHYTNPVPYYWGVGVDLGASTTVACGDVVLLGCNIERCAVGVRVANSASAAVRNVLMVGTRLKHGETGIANSGTGVSAASNTGNLTLQNCHLEKYDVSVDLDGADQTRIDGCFITGGDLTSADGVKIHEGCVGVKIDNCYFDSLTDGVNFVETTTGTLAELQILGSTFNSVTNSFQDDRTDSTRADRELVHITNFNLYDNFAVAGDVSVVGDTLLTGNLEVTGTVDIDGIFSGPIVASSLTINESAAPSSETGKIKIYSDPTFSDCRVKLENGKIQVLADKAVNTFGDGDVTPSITNGLVWTTANTGGTVITHFDGEFPCKWFMLFFGDDDTDIDFTSGTLFGNDGVLWTPVTGDSMICFSDGTNWYCQVSSNTV